jgi:ATP-dependent Lon protease
MGNVTVRKIIKYWGFGLFLFTGWYVANPFFLPSRFEVPTTNGGVHMPHVSTWTSWLFQNTPTGNRFRAWLNATHPNIMITYAGFISLAIFSPFIVPVISYARYRYLQSRYRSNNNGNTQTYNDRIQNPPKQPQLGTEVEETYSLEKVPVLPGKPQPSLEGCVRMPNPFGVEALKKRWETSTGAERETPMFKEIMSSTFPDFKGVRPVEPASVTALIPQFPNFKEVLEYIAGYCAVGKMNSTGIMAVNPILLFGPPGIGKTEFIYMLGEVLNLPVSVIGLGGNSGGSMILAGMNSGWKGSAPGQVASILATSATINPLFLLDEIDKLPSESQSGQSTVTAFLLQAMEKTSAKKLMDEFLGPNLPFDASRILWVAAANDLEPISAPLLSRFQVFEIPNLTPIQMVSVVRALADKVVKNMGVQERLKVTCDKEAMRILCNKTPREVRKILETTVLDCARDLAQNMTVSFTAKTLVVTKDMVNNK